MTNGTLANKSFRQALAAVFATLLITSISSLAVSTAPARAEEPDDMQVISSDSVTSDSGEVVAASGSNRFVLWNDNTPGNGEIFFKRSTDNGATWKATVNISNTPGDSGAPRLAVQGSYVYAVWIQGNLAGNQFDVYFRRSTDNGATWGPKVNISTDGHSGVNALAVSGQYVYIVYFSSGDLMFRRSTNNGATFDSKITLASGVSSSISIATSGSHIYVGWGTNDAYPIVKHSSNNGGTWDSAVELPGAGYGVENFRIAATGSYVYAVWLDVVGCDEDSIEFARSTDNGATWDGTTMAGCSDLVSSPVMAISGSKIFLLYNEHIQIGPTTWQTDIIIIRSTDNGATWNSETNLSNNPGNSYFNGIAVQNSNVYVIWTQLNAGGTLADIFLKRSTDSGATWKSSKNVSNNAGWSERGQIATSGSNVYIMWEDKTGGDVDLLFKRSTDNGATLKAVVNISNNNGASIEPRMMTTGSSIFIVWTDDTPGNKDILLRRSTDSGATWKAVKNLSNDSGLSQAPQIAG